MLAIIEHWETASCHDDNTGRYLQLILFKTGLDVLVLYLCWRKLHTSILSMCSLSIILADLVMVWALTAMWILGSAHSVVSLCAFLAHSSAVFASLPLPMAALGLLDYLLLERCYRSYRSYRNVTFKILRNAFLTSLLWTLSIAHSLGWVTGSLREIEFKTGATALVCEVQESPFIFYFTTVLLIAVVSTLLPHCTKIPQWYREAERLSDQRDEQKQGSDFLVISIRETAVESGEGRGLVENIQEWPSLWSSLMLGFALIWMPYLLISVVCQLLGLAVPAYIAVNLLWLECCNSVLAGTVFWLKSNKQGPYAQLPDDVCLWRVYWHLSRRTYPYQQKFPTAVIY